MHPDALDARRLARNLANEIPEATHLPALASVLNTPSPTIPTTTDGNNTSLQSLLDLAAELILEPEHTLRVARATRPLLLDVVARALSGLRKSRPAVVGAVTPVEQAEVMLIVMSRLLPAAPHCLPLALDHWRCSICPFECLRAPGGRSVDEDGESPPTVKEEQGEEKIMRRVHAVTEAAHKLLSSNVAGSCLRRLWNWAPFFDLCRHENILVRWRAVRVVSFLLDLDELGRRDLLMAAGAYEHCGGATVGAPAGAPFQSSRSSRGDGAAEESDKDILLEAGLDLDDDLRTARSALLRPNLCPDGDCLRSPQQSSPGHEDKGGGVDADDSITLPTGPATATATAADSTPGLEPDVLYNHHAAVADIGGILHPATTPTTDEKRVPAAGRAASAGAARVARFVRTPSARRNLASLSLAMTVQRPILLHGPAGSGKSLLAREAARLAASGGRGGGVGQTVAATSTMLELHLDDQTDSKSLLGAHACTDVPGEFAWRPGALTRAAAAGTWVLIEDVDRAPFEVLAALGPLLEGRPLTIPGRQKPLIAAPGFRVFGTVTTYGPGRVVLGGAADFGALWTHVPVEPLSVPEMLGVAGVRYPTLPAEVAGRLLDTMLSASGGAFSNGRGSNASSSTFIVSSAAGGREPGVRDFFKLCARVERLRLFDDNQSSSKDHPRPVSLVTDERDEQVRGHDEGGEDSWFCSEEQAVSVISESLDVFAGHLTTKGAAANAAEVLAGQWNVLPSKAVDLATTRRPELMQGQHYLRVGRVTLPRVAKVAASAASASFSPTSHALRLMEAVAASVQACEPVLLVGETGCGKTALVQRLAEGTGRQLIVQNLSLQTDGADLLGGFRPVELRQLAQDVLTDFLRIFPQLFSASQNVRFCQAITSSFERRQWKRLSAGLRNAAKMANEKLDRGASEEKAGTPVERAGTVSNKSRRSNSPVGMTSPSGQRRSWERFSADAERFEKQRMAVEGSFAFSFVEGVLVKAIREGGWVLLDEINLASAETLQRLSGLLEGAEGSLCLTERGDVDPVVRHEDFRLFAAMNPPTDASKKDLPPALRRRFSEVYVPELEDRMDLKRVADGYLAGISPEQKHLAFTAVDLYLWARSLAAESLSDGAGQRPRYSLRTLVGALSAARQLVDRGFIPKRAMVEGFRGAFETQLDSDGRAKILKGVMKAFGKGMTAKDLEKPPRRPGGRPGSKESWVRIGPFWLEGGPLDPVDAAELDPETKQRRFVLTSSVESTLRCLARAVASSESPVLLQGPTSAGKTSIVEYLAARLGHRCVRINNHEHTDIQEYTGSYAADGNGKLAFQEGVLVESLRKGHWIILDELNLAPSEVLEALNRLLDHNRELYLPETQETIKPHPSFRLFATQNPPGAYGGRKPLSRAFRNRFMEVHVDDIPGTEWQEILAERCGMAPSHCKLLVKILHELQAQRQGSRLFLGKHSAISPRDLLRWAGRKPRGKQQLAEEGYMLLTERLRTDDEKKSMKAVLEEQIGLTLDPSSLYGADPVPGTSDADEDVILNVDEEDLGGVVQLKLVEKMLDKGMGLDAGLQGVAMTRHMRRLFRLCGRCLSHREPVLLVGETGCGKTTVCQLYSMLLRKKMHIVNCHQNTEAADLLGGLRPLRGRDKIVSELRQRARCFLQRCHVAGAVHGHENDGAVRDSSFAEKLDVAGIMIIVQSAWNKLSKLARNLSSDGSQREVGKEGRIDIAKSHKPMKRGRATNTDPSGTVSRDDTKVYPSKTDVNPTAGEEPTRDTGGKGRGKHRRKGKKAKIMSDVKVTNNGAETSAGGPLEESRPLTTTDEVTRSAPSDDNVFDEEISSLATEFTELRTLANRTKGLFEWVDGPLVTAMKEGGMILLDELSLAEDAVLERLNSVLEPGRSITLAEKGGQASVGGQAAAETVVAAPGFRVMATMNPGGDFGKRELSPALRSRFTEVWVPSLSEREDMEGVVQKAFRFERLGEYTQDDELAQMAGPMLDFAWWFNNRASSRYGGRSGVSLSVRDLLSWAGFITSSLNERSSGHSASVQPMKHDGDSRVLLPWEAYVHGAALVLLDGIGLGAGLSPASVSRLREECGKMLAEQIPECEEKSSALAQLRRDSNSHQSALQIKFMFKKATSVEKHEDATMVCSTEEVSTPALMEFGAPPFFTPCGPHVRVGSGRDESKFDFSLQAPTTSRNLYRVLRALQVQKAVLLEGSPGVGKTSLLAALAAKTGHELVRINLSEQTDISDLFGSDLPVADTTDSQVATDGSSIEEETLQKGVDGGSGGTRFAWCDGVFLRALKEGKWVLLDELNLATQSVLEGLNACLDHRAEVYIPELGKSFHCPPTFRVFAAQNPLGQGGGRKGLPRSFLSRFTKVFVDPLTPQDLLYIAAHRFPALSRAGAPHRADSMADDAGDDYSVVNGEAVATEGASLLARMIDFNSRVQEDTMEASLYGRNGSPWEFNLRDVFRWCELMIREQEATRPIGHESDEAATGGEAWQPWLIVDTLYVQRMRTCADREALLTRFKEVFPEAFPACNTGGDKKEGHLNRPGTGRAEGNVGTRPLLRVTPDWLQIGQTVLPRGCWSEVAGRGGDECVRSRDDALMPVALRRPLQALARCVAMGWPSLVVGHRGSGKTSLIRGLAAGVGARLTEVAMTPSMDVTELLGCFEQADTQSQQVELFECLEYVAEAVCIKLCCSDSDVEHHSLTASVWDAFHTVQRCYINPTGHAQMGDARSRGVVGFDKQGMIAVEFFLQVVRGVVEEESTNISGTTMRASATRKDDSFWSNLRQHLHQAKVLAAAVQRQNIGVAQESAGKNQPRRAAGKNQPRRAGASCFKWSDGILVKALQRGDWLVFESANLCSASVLDRINPLLEPGGVLMLTECGSTSDGDETHGAVDSAAVHRVVRPHPNFRLFLTADPSCGEVSRAMRNRCVEIFLLDNQAGVSLEPAATKTAGRGYGSPSVLFSEHASDLLSIIGAYGLGHLSALTAAMISTHCTQRARPAHGESGPSAAGGTTPRSLALLAELVAAAYSRGVTSCDHNPHEVLEKVVSLAYPRLTTATATGGELLFVKAMLSSLLPNSNDISGCAASAAEGVTRAMMPPEWRARTSDSVGSQVSADGRVLCILEVITDEGSSRAGEMLASLVLEGTYTVGAVEGAGNTSPALDTSFFVGLRDITTLDKMEVSREDFFSHLASHFVRRTSVADRGQRAALAARISQDRNGRGRYPKLSDLVIPMTEALMESHSWAEISAILSDLKDQVKGLFSDKTHGNAEAPGSLLASASAALSVWAPADPRSNIDHLYGVERFVNYGSTWKPLVLYLSLLDAAVGMRLPLILREEAEVSKASSRLKSGRSGEGGLGWIGLSYLVSKGGRNITQTSSRGGLRSAETRLARTALVPYLAPLLFAVDSWLKQYLCRQVVDIVTTLGEKAADEFHSALAGVYHARDSLSHVLATTSANQAEPDASAGAVLLVFPWDLFLVSWSWVCERTAVLRSVSPPAVTELSGVSSTCANFEAVRSRIEAAVVQHAGGSSLASDSLWAHGARAAAPTTGAAACALGRLHRLASEFRVSYRPHASSGISTSPPEAAISLGSLLESAHPSLCVPDDAKRELLHALCTLQWAASSEVEEIGDSTLRTDPADEGVERNGRDGPATTVALAESLPQVLEEVVRTAQARFTMAHKGTRYDVDVSKNEPAQEDRGVQDTRRFDDFETEAQEAVANSTLLVVSDHADDDREGENVLRRWAAVQLASFMEHWIVAEECKVLAALSQLSLENQETFSDLNRAAPLMPRIVRLRSALLATPTLSPAVARPYQTLIWAWENNLSASGLRAMLKKILPVALDAWGQRLWDNLFQSPGTILTELGPPRMVQDADDIVFPGVTGSKRRDHPDDTSWGGGPAQLLTLVRSAFLLRLSSSSVLQDKLTSDTARARGAQRREVVDLTLMNVSARMAQFRTAMRLLRDLESASEEVLEKVLSLAWCRLYETLCSFDEASPAAEGVPSFSRAFLSPRERGDPPRTTASRVCRNPDEFEVEARKALSSCRDNRLTDLGDTLIVPCARAMCYASKAVGSSLCDEVESAQALTGLGITLLGCLRLMLLLPSSPVDPGMKPSLEKKLLERRLATVKGDLTAWRWLSRLEGGEDVPPGMEPLLQQARRLREECRRLGSESIERAADRPAFQTLFRDVHAFARGVGNPERVSSLAHNLSSLAGVADPPQEGLHQSRSETGSSAKAAKSRSAALEEEVVWQEAAGSFLERMRTEYMEAYPDVMTGLCDAIETCRLGLRLLAAACATNALGKSSAEESARQPGAVPTSCDSLIRLQSFLLRYPYPACERPTVNTARHDREDDGDSLGEELNFALTYRVPNGRGGSGAQHMALLQAVLSRAEILLLSGSLEAPAVDCALKAMGAAVTAWSEAEAEKAEKEETEAEIIKYKMQEHVVQSAEAVDEKRLRMLFPDYHSRFKDILTAESDDSTADAIAADSVAAQEPSEDCTQPHALRHLSDEQLSSLVACHARLLLSLAVRKRIALRRLSVHYAAPTAGDDVSNSLVPARVMAFGDSYRAAVLLAGPTASAPACVPRLVSRPDDVGKDANIRGKFLDLEAAFAPAHMLAISDAARMCKSGTTLLWDASATKMCADFTRKSMMRGTSVKEEGVSGRSYEFVDSHVDFHRDPNVRETRLTDRPLTALLRRAANLLEEFPGHGILIQLARVADRVRRMPLHSPLAAVLAGVELTLRKAQDWEQNAHRGVSLKEELGPLSALVVRWRGIELKGWPQLLDGRERASVTKGSRWWLHLYRLLDGKWLGEADQDSLVEASTTGDHEAEESPTKVLSVPDWPTAKESFADWVWHGLVPEDRQFTRREAAKGGLSGFDPAGFARIRILFQALDDFIRTSSVGEFMARLQMLQAFAAHICAVAEEHPQSTTVAVVVQGIWRFYSQFSDDVMSSRDLVRNSIEKKLKEEVKLAKWDEQTYYSLAEASEKSHRKLCKLVSQYDEVLEVSVSEVLNRVFTAGVGERNDAGAKRAAPCTEIPSVGSMFAMVKKVDSSADFVEADADSDEAERNVADDTVMIHGVVVEAREPMEKELQKPEAKSRSARPCHASRTSLQLLDVCLPKEPQLLHSTREIVTDPRSIGWSPWLKVALLADSSTGSDGNTNKVGSLTARLSMLKKRMRSLLRESVYAKKSARWTRNGRWTDGGRPVGFLGAGLAEELCLAVFGRIQALRATTIGKQVKKRAVLDLLVGMRKQGLKHAKSFTPGEASDMLHVMAIPQPFAADQLAGTEPSWLLDNSVIEGHAPTPGAASAVRDILHRGERYFFKSLSELSRLRLEAGAPVARDLSRREAEVMKGLSEHLGLVILQQRGTAVALEREISRFAREINALRSLVRDYSIGGGKEEPSYPVDSMAVDENAAFPAAASTKKPLPAQRSLRRAVEAQRQGLRRSVESVREVQLLVKAMAEADPPSPSTPVTPNGTGWGQNPTDSASSTEATAAVSDLEQKTSVMLARLDQFPAPPISTSTKDESSSDVAVPLLAAGAVAAVLENQESLACLATETRAISRKFSNVIPVAALQRVGDHLSCIIDTVRTCLNSDPVLRFWWVMQPGSTRFSESEVRAMSSTQPLQSSSPAIDLIALDAAQSATVDHMRQFGKKINFAVKSMLISVQSLCRGPRPSSVEDGKSDTTADGEVLLPERTTDSDSDGADEGLSVTGTTLMETHASSFEQARSLKLWRCADALRSVRTCMVEFSEAVTATGWADGAAPAAEATVAAVTLLRDVLPLAEQVLGAGRAVLTGIVAFNKGTAKLHYVTLRVFRLLLSKGLCSDETEEMEGDGEGDIEGMKFDDDVEGTGMGEGDGKKDVTDQIEDEEQLLGLKGDEPDKDQAEEVKELGEDEQDKGMEMENDFEGDMFDVPKGDQNDEGEEEAEDKEELDREMGDDLGDNADVVDEKLWDDDDDGQEEGKDEQEEKFEAGSRLDGEKPEEDEIRTKEDGHDDDEDGEGKEKDGGKEEDKGENEADGNPEGNTGDDGVDQENADDEHEDGDDGEKEGLVNDDLEENYEDKPMGVEVRGEEEAMKVDEGQLDGEDKDPAGEDNPEELPDDLNLDEAQNDEDGDEGGGAEEGKDDDGGSEGGDGDEEGKEKEGFETLAPEDEAAETPELGQDENQPEGAGNPGAPEVDPVDEEGADADGGEDKDEGDETEKVEDQVENGKDEPPAFGVEGDDGDARVTMDASKDEMAEDNDGDDEDAREDDGKNTEAGGGSAAQGADDGGGGGKGEEGDGGEWRRDESGGNGTGEGHGKDKRRRPEAPNPFRNPGDVMKHWHRRLDMLKDNTGDEDLDGDEDTERGDEESGDKDDGKFEYVTSNEEGSSQVLGGVSEEQAAETAASQAADEGEKKEIDQATVQGTEESDDDADAADAKDGLDEGEDQKGAVSDADGEEGEHAQRGDRNRKSGKKREEDGHEQETEQDADVEMVEADEEDDSTVEKQPPVDLKLLDNADERTNPNQPQIVTSADIHGEASNVNDAQALREQLHDLAEELQRRRRDAEVDEEAGIPDAGAVLPAELWGKLRGVTAGLSQRLCEQLRLVLEPMVATKLQGDYRSGKRINMRRVIPYIASGFRKDKIWLRRTKPAKRDYQILMAIDDSQSMADCGAGALALAAMTTVASGLTQLEAGQLAVARFGEQLDLLHAFGESFTEQAGAKIVSGFTFDQPRTNTAHMLEGVVALLEEARRSFSFSSGGASARGTPRQLVLMLSDGRFDRENKDRLRTLVREMNERGQLLVLIVLDKEGDTSILKTREASYVGGKLVLSSYLDKYPFPFYILLNHVEALPETLADALRQWFELLQRQMSS